MSEEEFEEICNEVLAGRPIYKSLKFIESGIPRWRLHILERNTAPNGGDRELLCIERPTKEAALAAGGKILRERMQKK